MKIEFIEVDKLKEHEEVIHDHLNCVCEEIMKNRWIKPILVDKNTSIILDGHHRYNSLLKLGMSVVPVCFVDYMDDAVIELRSWRKGESYTKDDVIQIVNQGKKFPPKTTRHIVKVRFDLPVVEL